MWLLLRKGFQIFKVIVHFSFNLVGNLGLHEWLNLWSTKKHYFSKMFSGFSRSRRFSAPGHRDHLSGGVGHSQSCPERPFAAGLRGIDEVLPREHPQNVPKWGEREASDGRRLRGQAEKAEQGLFKPEMSLTKAFGISVFSFHIIFGCFLLFVYRRGTPTHDLKIFWQLADIWQKYFLY